MGYLSDRRKKFIESDARLDCESKLESSAIICGLFKITQRDGNHNALLVSPSSDTANLEINKNARFRNLYLSLGEEITKLIHDKFYDQPLDAKTKEGIRIELEKWYKNAKESNTDLGVLELVVERSIKEGK